MKIGSVVQHRWAVRGALGEGGMGTTVRAWDELLEREVALKVLRDRSADLSAAFKSEFARLTGVAHPHLCTVHDFGRFTDERGTQRLFYTAEYVPGPTLDELARARSFDEVLAPLAQALDALGFLHRLGLRHGDFKPQNVLVDGARGVLIDLGCSHPLDDSISPMVSGTPGFIAPEILNGARVDARADLYAVGVTLARLGEHGSGLPARVEELARRLMRPRAVDRPNDVEEVLEVLTGRPSTPARASSQPARLLGRERELEAIRRALAELLQGADGARALVFCGSEGAGRTRLIQEAKWAAQLSCPVVEANCRQPAAVVAMLRRALRDPSLPDGWSAVLGAWDRIAGEGPLVLVLDDAHELSAEERELYLGLLRSIEPSSRCLIIASELKPPDVASSALQVLKLGPLGAADVARWTEAAIAPARAADILRLTGGYPAAIRSLLTSLSSGECTIADLESAATEGALTERRLVALRTADDATQRIIGLVSALGGALDDRTAETAGIDRELLGRLVTRGWLIRDSGGFRLERSGEAPALLAELDPGMRRDVVLSAAELIANRAQELVSGSAAQSAARARRVRLLDSSGLEHQAEAELLASRDLFRAHAGPWLATARQIAAREVSDGALLAAAEIHEAAGRANEALALLRRLLARRPAAELRARVRLHAGAAYLKLSDTRRALAQLRYAERHIADPDLRAAALDLASRALIRRGAYSAAIEAAERGLAGAIDVAQRADLYDDLGVAKGYEGDLDGSRSWLARAATLHEQAGNVLGMARSASYAAFAEYRAGNASAAYRGYRRALELAEHASADELIAHALLNVGTAAHQLGELGPASIAYERGLRLALALDRPSVALTLRVNLAKLYNDIGLYDRALQSAQAAAETARTLGMPQMNATALAFEAAVALGRGDAVRALALFDAARALYEEHSAQREIVEVDLERAEANLVLGEIARSEAIAAQSFAAAVQLNAADVLSRAHFVRGRIELEKGNLSGAITDLEEALARAESAQQRVLVADVAALLSRACLRQGATALARRHAQTARELWERVSASLSPEQRDVFWSHPARAAHALPSEAPAAHAERERKLERLLEVNKKLASSLETEQILAWTIDSAIELTRAERGFVLLSDEEELRVAVSRNMHREGTADGTLGFSRSIAERAIRSGEPLVTVDAQGDARFSGNQSVHAMRLKSVVCVPIRASEGVIGAVYLDHRFRRGSFGPADTELLLGFADQVAIALTNARLHAALARRTHELEQERQRIQLLMKGQADQIDRLAAEVRTKQRQLELRYEYASIVGRSSAMQAVLATLDRVIDTPVSVLVQGESGTGKELIARAIHFNGPRKEGPFVAINCGAIPEPLLESELFGYVRGAFTGATRDKVGLLVSARGGTLFLDELGEMPAGMQVKLLRVLQEREVQPLGSDAAIPIDIRLVCATKRKLRDEIARGSFREDLFYRVAVVEIEVPPLRERAEDVPAIAARIVESVAQSLARPVPRLAPAALRALVSHPWPGNVRELENVLTKAVILSDGSTIEEPNLELPAARVSSAPPDREGYQHHEAGHIFSILSGCRWNVTEASRRLGIPRATLYRKLRRYRLERPEL